MREQTIKEPGIIFLSRGAMANGNRYWAYLLIMPEKVEPYLKASMDKLPFKLQDFGDIISWGEGDEPPEANKKEMAELYGADENFVKDFMVQMEQTKAGKDFVAMIKNQMVVAKKPESDS